MSDFSKKWVNEYGNVDVSDGCPDTLHHYDDARKVMPTLTNLGIESHPAFTGYRKSGGQYYPIIKGCVILVTDKPAVDAALALKASKPKPVKLTPDQLSERRLAKSLGLSVAKLRLLSQDEIKDLVRKIRSDNYQAECLIIDGLIAVHCQYYEIDPKLVDDIKQVLYLFPEWAEAVCQGFDDLWAMNAEWLRDSLIAASKNKLLGGTAYQSWVNRAETDMEFHQFLRLAKGASDRHEKTDYDQLLRAGYDRDTARAIMSEI